MIKQLLKYCIILISLITFYILFGLVSWYLPDERIKNSVKYSVEMGDIQEDYPRAIVNKEMCRMDNCTDALILNQTYNMKLMSPLSSVMLVPSMGGETRNVDALNRLVIGENQPTQTYARYWHGSTFLMRFLTLLIGRYANIRLFFYYTSSLLMLLLTYMLIRKGAVRAALSLCLAFIILKGYVLQFSIQFYPVLVLSIVGALLMIIHQTSFHRILLSLFIIGSLTAYFDLLTTPLLTLGVPLLVLIACQEKTWSENLPSSLLRLLSVAALWATGYSVTWASKWLLATCITPVHVFTEAFSVGVYRIAGEVPQLGSYTILDSLTANIRKCPLQPIAITFTLFAITMLVFFRKRNLRLAVCYLAVSLLPCLWYLVLANHSFVHCWFTYRAFIISLAGLFMACLCLINWVKIKDKFHQ